MSTTDKLAQALRAARACIWIDRTSMADTGVDPSGAIDPDTATALAEYDAVIQQIDDALATHKAVKAAPLLLGGMRFKVTYDKRQSGGQIHGIPPELGGRWVAFVAAEDDMHMHTAAPVAVPRTDREVVEQTEALADMLMSWAHQRVKSDPLLNYRDSQDTRARQCWMMACEIQEFLTCTDAQNAAQELEGGEA